MDGDCEVGICCGINSEAVTLQSNIPVVSSVVDEFVIDCVILTRHYCCLIVGYYDSIYKEGCTYK